MVVDVRSLTLLAVGVAAVPLAVCVGVATWCFCVGLAVETVRR